MTSKTEEQAEKSPAMLYLAMLIVGITALAMGLLHGGPMRESLILGGGILTMIGGVGAAAELWVWIARRKDR